MFLEQGFIDDATPRPANQREDAREAMNFALDDVPANIVAHDPPSQEEILRHLFTGADERSANQRSWTDTAQCPVKLSHLKKYYEHRNEHAAVDLLKKRAHLEIDSKFMISPHSANLVWQTKNHFLDFLLVVSRDIGLDACIPTRAVDHQWTCTWNLHQSYREFNAKYGKLGFDPTGRMLCAGRVGPEFIWFAFCPREVIEGEEVFDDVHCPQPLKAGDTRLLPLHYRMFMMFLADVLAAMPFRHIHVQHPWGDIDEDGWTIGERTNLL